jgi:hypothetical protein
VLFTLDRLAIGTAVIAGFTVVAVHRIAPVRDAMRARTYHLGEHIDAIEKQYFERAERTIIIILRNGSHASEVNMPLYRAMIARARETMRLSQTVVVVTLESNRARALEYVGRHELAVDDVMVLSPERRNRLKIMGTPTVLTASRSGTVTHQWIGTITADKESRILNDIFFDER